MGSVLTPHMCGCISCALVGDCLAVRSDAASAAVSGAHGVRGDARIELSEPMARRKIEHSRDQLFRVRLVAVSDPRVSSMPADRAQGTAAVAIGAGLPEAISATGQATRTVRPPVCKASSRQAPRQDQVAT